MRVFVLHGEKVWTMAGFGGGGGGGERLAQALLG